LTVLIRGYVHCAEPRPERHGGEPATGRGAARNRPSGLRLRLAARFRPAARFGRADMAAEHDNGHRPRASQPQGSARGLSAGTRGPGVIEQGDLRTGRWCRPEPACIQVPYARFIT
jgi:hypothetical protein